VSLADIPREKLAVKWFLNVSRSRVMVWGVVSKKRGKLLLLFIETRVKINQNYYIKNLLKNHYLEKVRRKFAWFFFTKQLACIITKSQPIGLFYLGIRFKETRLQKTQDFDQIQNLFDEDSRRNAHQKQVLASWKLFDQKKRTGQKIWTKLKHMKCYSKMKLKNKFSWKISSYFQIDFF
jgi:hypothetical protein